MGGNLKKNEFLYVDAVEKNGLIHVWVRDQAGLDVITYDATDYHYCFIPNNTDKMTPYKDMWGCPVRKCKFGSKRDLREFAFSEDYVCESDIPGKYKVLIDELPNAYSQADFHYCFYDIEVDFDLEEGKGYPKPDNPYGEINAISAWDSYRQRYTIFLFDFLKGQVNLEDDDEYPVKMIFCHNERDLLQKFAHFLEPIDVFTGWYSSGFDLPYIMARAEMNFGLTGSQQLLCRDGFRAWSTEFVNDFGEEKIKWQTVGRKHIDLLEIYKKFIPGQRTSYKLDSICEEDLGENKIQYEDEGDLGILYKENPQKFFEYSLHDSRLLVKLDRKHNLVKTAMMIAVSSFSFVDDVTGSLKVIEQGFNKFCRDKGIVLPDKKDHDKSSFPGAIVYDTVSGRHGWSFSIDTVSMYPTAIIMLGLSPETMIYQCVGGEDDYVKIMTNSDDVIEVQDVITEKVEEVTPTEFYDLIVKEGWTISANGTIFNGKLGLLAEYLQDGFAERKECKRLSKEYDKQGDAHNAEIFDLKQKILKIARLNAIYGATGNEHFRFFDLRIAKSVTLTARVISRFQSVASNEILEEFDEEMKGIL